MDYSRYHYLSAERKDKILIVSFNRPESLNAINAASAYRTLAYLCRYRPGSRNGSRRFDRQRAGILRWWRY